MATTLFRYHHNALRYYELYGRSREAVICSFRAIATPIVRYPIALCGLTVL